MDTIGAEDPLPPSRKDDRLAAHWRRLGLAPNAPECAIKAAYRYHIEQHHPDRGGSEDAAKSINRAHDELRGHGSKANDHVARHYDREPWHVLGLASNADAALAERVGRQMCVELSPFPRLLARVEWAIGSLNKPPARVVPLSPPPRRKPERLMRPERVVQPAAPGRPDGLPESGIDLGTLSWRAEESRDIRLTWERLAPYDVRAVAAAPLTVRVTASKTRPGRFVLSIGIDWESEVFSHGPLLRGHNLDATVTVRWPGDEAQFRVRGTVLYPAEVTASPLALDLGNVTLKQTVRGTLLLVSTAPVSVAIESSAWLARCDAAGRAVDAPIRLRANTPVRVVFNVQWGPIIERIRASVNGKPVRPTGKITVRWNDRVLEVPAQMVVKRP